LAEEVCPWNVFQAMDIFVLCSDHEGLSMAFGGLGVCGSDRCVEMMQHGVNGILLESAEPALLAKIRIQVLPDEEVFEVYGNLVKEKFDTAGTDRIFRLYFSLWETK
jgi:hypothetical protein